jgi:hypothetical protein
MRYKLITIVVTTAKQSSGRYAYLNVKTQIRTIVSVNRQR